ncbi:MAG: sialidase family protein, partial [Pirellulaceae bacterium]
IVRDLGEAGGGRTSFAILRLPQGEFAFYNRLDPLRRPLTLNDRHGIRHELLPAPADDLLRGKILESDVLNNTQVVVTPSGEVFSVTVKAETLDKETAVRVGLPRYLNVWGQRASAHEAHAPRMIWRGYNGSQMEYEQLPSGRLIVPYGSFQPHGKTEPPHGRHKTIVQLSDDLGNTWRESPSQLVSPCYPGFNGSNEGACEPTIERLRDGRIWMLMRTQAGFLYESLSEDEGETWSTAAASRFHTSTGPANILRHRNGWLVVTWNNCELPPRADGQGVYGGRDALHIAVSDDDGATWRGFREIYLDHRRNDNPARSGDRGTAYPLGAFTRDGRLVVLSGQGEGGRNPILIDPEWITATAATTDFADGLEQWSVYKHFGPAKGWWRGRTSGARLVPNPLASGKMSLELARRDELPPDGATWNFPNGWAGRLTARVLVRSGSAGGLLSLNDRMFDPCNDAGEELAVFRVAWPRDSAAGELALAPDQWHDVSLEWDLSRDACRVTVDDKFVRDVPLQNPTLNGISYVRFRSTARDVDAAGFLVDRVDVRITEPRAPIRSAEEKRAHEQQYIQTVVPRWVRR